jgi:hypothetical protein
MQLTHRSRRCETARYLFTVKPQANVVEFLDLRIELSPVSGATWRDFYRTMVIEGHSTPMDEKTGKEAGRV